MWLGDYRVSVGDYPDDVNDTFTECHTGRLRSGEYARVSCSGTGTSVAIQRTQPGPLPLCLCRVRVYAGTAGKALNLKSIHIMKKLFLLG